ncbi:MAG: hypothetical protein PHR77_15280 [Kiritimatiellae bacterium]|nr:hypothetical protein [Kiritimatiellia bacterium]MDD5523436.1 hypothetical protein [Kiritimatiellia bacterium]
MKIAVGAMNMMKRFAVATAVVMVLQGIIFFGTVLLSSVPGFFWLETVPFVLQQTVYVPFLKMFSGIFRDSGCNDVFFAVVIGPLIGMVIYSLLFGGATLVVCIIRRKYEENSPNKGMNGTR